MSSTPSNTATPSHHHSPLSSTFRSGRGGGNNTTGGYPRRSSPSGGSGHRTPSNPRGMGVSANWSDTHRGSDGRGRGEGRGRSGGGRGEGWFKGEISSPTSPDRRDTRKGGWEDTEEEVDRNLETRKSKTDWTAFTVPLSSTSSVPSISPFSPPAATLQKAASPLSLLHAFATSTAVGREVCDVLTTELQGKTLLRGISRRLAGSGGGNSSASTATDTSTADPLELFFFPAWSPWKFPACGLSPEEEAYRNSARTCSAQLRPLTIAVEPYRRAAAGKVLSSSDLRTVLALEKSMHFLVEHYLRDPNRQHQPSSSTAESASLWWEEMRRTAQATGSIAPSEWAKELRSLYAKTALLWREPDKLWLFLWDRFRGIRSSWIPQLPPVGDYMSCDVGHDRHPLMSIPYITYRDDETQDVMSSEALQRENKRRIRWLEFMVAALYFGAASMCRTAEGCQSFLQQKKNVLESISQCFTDLAVWYRTQKGRYRHAELFSVLLLIYGLQQELKVEDRSSFCQFEKRQLQTAGGINEGGGEGSEANEESYAYCPEPPSQSINLVQVYQELERQPHLIRTRPVRAVLRLLHCWANRSYFEFLSLCREGGKQSGGKAKESHAEDKDAACDVSEAYVHGAEEKQEESKQKKRPRKNPSPVVDTSGSSSSFYLTPLQRAVLFQSFTYARFRAVLDLLQPNYYVFSGLRLRDHIPISTLAYLLLMEVPHCLRFLEALGVSHLLEERTHVPCSILLPTTPSSSPSLPTSPVLVLRLCDEKQRPLISSAELMDKCASKAGLFLPTYPTYFSFSPWHTLLPLSSTLFHSELDGRSSAAAADVVHVEGGLQESKEEGRNERREENPLHRTSVTLGTTGVPKCTLPLMKPQLHWGLTEEDEYTLLSDPHYPVDWMTLLEPYCPPYPEELANYVVEDVAEEPWFSCIPQHRREALTRYLVQHDSSSMCDGYGEEDEERWSTSFVTSLHVKEDEQEGHPSLSGSLEATMKKFHKKIEEWDRESLATRESLLEDGEWKRKEWNDEEEEEKVDPQKEDGTERQDWKENQQDSKEDGVSSEGASHEEWKAWLNGKYDVMRDWWKTLQDDPVYQVNGSTSHEENEEGEKAMPTEKALDVMTSIQTEVAATSWNRKGTEAENENKMEQEGRDTTAEQASSWKAARVEMLKSTAAVRSPMEHPPRSPICRDHSSSMTLSTLVPSEDAMPHVKATEAPNNTPSSVVTSTSFSESPSFTAVEREHEPSSLSSTTPPFLALPSPPLAPSIQEPATPDVYSPLPFSRASCEREDSPVEVTETVESENEGKGSREEKTTTKPNTKEEVQANTFTSKISSTPPPPVDVSDGAPAASLVLPPFVRLPPRCATALEPRPSSLSPSPLCPSPLARKESTTTTMASTANVLRGAKENDHQATLTAYSVSALSCSPTGITSERQESRRCSEEEEDRRKKKKRNENIDEFSTALSLAPSPSPVLSTAAILRAFRWSIQFHLNRLWEIQEALSRKRRCAEVEAPLGTFSPSTRTALPLQKEEESKINHRLRDEPSTATRKEVEEERMREEEWRKEKEKILKKVQTAVATYQELLHLRVNQKIESMHHREEEEKQHSEDDAATFTEHQRNKAGMQERGLQRKRKRDPDPDWSLDLFFMDAVECSIEEEGRRDAWDAFHPGISDAPSLRFEESMRSRTVDKFRNYGEDERCSVPVVPRVDDCVATMVRSVVSGNRRASFFHRLHYTLTFIAWKRLSSFSLPGGDAGCAVSKEVYEPPSYYKEKNASTALFTCIPQAPGGTLPIDTSSTSERKERRREGSNPPFTEVTFPFSFGVASPVFQLSFPMVLWLPCQSVMHTMDSSACSGGALLPEAQIEGYRKEKGACKHENKDETKKEIGSGIAVVQVILQALLCTPIRCRETETEEKDEEENENNSANAYFNVSEGVQCSEILYAPSPSSFFSAVPGNLSHSLFLCTSEVRVFNGGHQKMPYPSLSSSSSGSSEKSPLMFLAPLPPGCTAVTVLPSWSKIVQRGSRGRGGHFTECSPEVMNTYSVCTEGSNQAEDIMDTHWRDCCALLHAAACTALHYLSGEENPVSSSSLSFSVPVRGLLILLIPHSEAPQVSVGLTSVIAADVLTRRVKHRVQEKWRHIFLQLAMERSRRGKKKIESEENSSPIWRTALGRSTPPFTSPPTAAKIAATSRTTAGGLPRYRPTSFQYGSFSWNEDKEAEEAGAKSLRPCVRQEGVAGERKRMHMKVKARKTHYEVLQGIPSSDSVVTRCIYAPSAPQNKEEIKWRRAAEQWMPRVCVEYVSSERSPTFLPEALYEDSLAIVENVELAVQRGIKTLLQSC